MRGLGLLGVLSVALAGCDARTGSSAQLPDVPIYPGAKIVINGENRGVVSAVIESSDPREKVIAFYARELGVSPDPSGAGNLAGTKNGHEIRIIVTDAGHGKTSASITQPK